MVDAANLRTERLNVSVNAGRANQTIRASAVSADDAACSLQLPLFDTGPDNQSAHVSRVFNPPFLDAGVVVEENSDSFGRGSRFLRRRVEIESSPRSRQHRYDAICRANAVLETRRAPSCAQADSEDEEVKTHVLDGMHLDSSLLGSAQQRVRPVDDEPSICGWRDGRPCRGNGCSVVQAGQWAENENRSETSRPWLVLTDIECLGSQRLEVIRENEERVRHGRVCVVMTAYGSIEGTLRPMKCGAIE